MIYLKNNTEPQSIYIPRQTVLGGGYVATTKTYEDGLMEGIEKGKEIQKDQLLNLYVTENGQYEREDGWGVVTVDVPTEGGGDCSGAYNDGYDKGKSDGYDSGYQDGYNQGQTECPTVSLENGSFTASRNGEYTITPSEGFDGLESLNLTVDVPTEGSPCKLTTKSVSLSTESTTIRASDEGFDGYSEVTIAAWPYGDVRYAEGYDAGVNASTGAAYTKIAMEINCIETPNIFNDDSLRDDDLKAVWTMSTADYKAVFNTLAENGVNQLAQNFLRNYTRMISVNTYTLTSIGENAFKDWSNLSNIEMSKNMKRLGSNAFQGCSSLSSIICRAENAPILGTSVFNGVSETGTLRVPNSTYDVWLQELGDGWTIEYL